MCGFFKSQLWCTLLINRQITAGRPTPFSFLRQEKENDFSILALPQICFALEPTCIVQVPFLVRFGEAVM